MRITDKNGDIEDIADSLNFDEESVHLIRLLNCIEYYLTVGEEALLSEKSELVFVLNNLINDTAAESVKAVTERVLRKLNN